MNTKMIATLSAIAAVMIAGSTALAAPDASATSQSNPPPQQQSAAVPNKRNDKRGPVLEGRIASIISSTITLEPKNRRDTAGPVISVNERTTYYVPGVSNATIANLKTGDRVAILLDKTTSNTARVASAVSVLPLPESAIVAGSVSNISASGFTLTGPRGNSGTVSATGAKVIVPGRTTASMSDIQNGARVAVQGKPAGGQSIDATLIVVVPQNRDNMFAGVIAAINGNTLTLFTRAGQQLTVDVSGAVIFERGSAASTIADLKAGRPITVIGIKNADGSVTAQLVGQANLPFFRRLK